MECVNLKHDQAPQCPHHGIHIQRLKSRCCPKKILSPSVCCLRRQAMHSVAVTALELLHRHPCPFWDRSDLVFPGTFRQQLHYNSIYNFTTRYYRITTRTVVGFVSCRNFCRTFFFCSVSLQDSKKRHKFADQPYRTSLNFKLVLVFQFWRAPEKPLGWDRAGTFSRSCPKPDPVPGPGISKSRSSLFLFP